MSDKTTRERILEWQIKLLADRLAMAMTMITSFELDAMIEKRTDDEVYLRGLQEILASSNDRLYDRARKKWRNDAMYGTRLAGVKDMLKQRLHTLRKKKSDAS